MAFKFLKKDKCDLCGVEERDMTVYYRNGQSEGAHICYSCQEKQHIKGASLAYLIYHSDDPSYEDMVQYSHEINRLYQVALNRKNNLLQTGQSVEFGVKEFLDLFYIDYGSFIFNNTFTISTIYSQLAVDNQKVIGIGYSIYKGHYGMFKTPYLLVLITTDRIAPFFASVLLEGFFDDIDGVVNTFREEYYTNCRYYGRLEDVRDAICADDTIDTEIRELVKENMQQALWCKFPFDEKSLDSDSFSKEDAMMMLNALGLTVANDKL